MLGSPEGFLLPYVLKKHSFILMLKLFYLPLLVYLSVSSFAIFETESFEERTGMENIEAQGQQEIQEQYSRDAQGISNGVNEGAWAERALSQKRKLRSDLDEYLKLQASATADSSPEFLEALSKRRDYLINNGIDPDYEKYRAKIKRNEDIVYAATRYINPTTGLFGEVSAQDVENNNLEKVLTAEQLNAFKAAPAFMQDKYIFDLIVENFFPDVKVDQGVALELLKKHYNTDHMHGVVSKYVQEL